MKKIALAALAASLMASTAMAADLPPMPAKAPFYNQAEVPFTWAGLYAGLNVGYADGYGRDGVAGLNKLSTTLVGTGAVPGTLGTAGSGWLGGVQAGYNWVFPYNSAQTAGPSAVVGFEADFDLSGLYGSDSRALTTAPIGFPASLVTSATREDRWLSTIRGRIGTTLPFFGPTTLLYVTGGLALADVDAGTTVALATPIKALNGAASASSNGVRAGWTVGGGVETALSQHWTWKAEYLFVDLGSHGGTMGAAVAGAPVAFGTSQNLNEHVVRLGLNYKF